MGVPCESRDATIADSTAGAGTERTSRHLGRARLPQELRLHGIGTVEAANAFLGEHYIGEFNRRFQVASAQPGSAFTPCRAKDLERVFSLQFERTVNRDNTVSFQNLTLQIEPVRWRGTLAGCTVIVHQHLDGTLSLSYGRSAFGRYDEAAGDIRAHASGVADVPAELLGQADVLQTQPVDSGKRPEYLLSADERGGFTRNCSRQPLVFAGIGRTVDEEEILLGRPDHDV